jgi:hypothetical protein
MVIKFSKKRVSKKHQVVVVPNTTIYEVNFKKKTILSVKEVNNYEKFAKEYKKKKKSIS